MKGGVEDRHLRHIGSAGHGHLDAQEVGGIVQRRKGREAPNGLDDPFVDQARFAKRFAAVNDSVSDPEQISSIPRLVRSQTHNSVERCGVVGNVAVRLANALGGAPCNQSPLRHVEELVLER